MMCTAVFNVRVGANMLFSITISRVTEHRNPSHQHSGAKGLNILQLLLRDDSDDLEKAETVLILLKAQVLISFRCVGVR